MEGSRRPDDDDPASRGLSEATARGLSRRSVGPGRVGTYAALGAAAGTVPLPWLPDVAARRVRGALVQDIAARGGLSLTRDARDLLSEPAGTEGPRGVGAQAVRFVTRRLLGRFGPLAFAAPLRSGVETFVLGHLFARYLEGSRVERSTRIDVEEARRVRRAIDRAIILVVSPEVHAQIETRPQAPEELRDPVTQLVDGVLMTFASAPEWVLRRLEAAFDDAIVRSER
jgi:hypothetical protein